MLKVIDKKNYRRFKGRKLKTVYRHKRNEWRCTTPKGAYVHIVYKGGVVALTGGNCEYDLGQSVFLIASTVDHEEDFGNEDFSPSDHAFVDYKLDYKLLPKKNKYPEICFQDIMDFMEWECDPEQIWDGYIG
jgi:hypothetical protein